MSEPQTPPDERHKTPDPDAAKKPLPVITNEDIAELQRLVMPERLSKDTQKQK